MPKDIFSLSGIFNLVLQVLGLGWDYIRLKAVKMMGEPVVKALEGGYDMFKTFATKGVDGIWEFLKDKFSDLKEVVIDAIKDMLITQVIQAGIKWLLSLLIPGAGFIKAIMAIKDLIVFFVESAMMLIPAITEAILALAAGSVAGVAKAIEFGLAQLIGLVINLFAKLIGLGGLSKKVQAIFKKIRKRVDKAVGKLLKKARKAGRKLMGKLGFTKKTKGGEKNNPEKQQKIDKGLAALQQEEKKYLVGGEITRENADKVAQKVKQQNPVFKTFKVIDGTKRWDYEYTASPKVKVEGEKKKGDEGELAPGEENKSLGILKSSSISNRNGTTKGESSILAANLGTGILPSIGTRSDYAAHHLIATNIGKKSLLVKAGVHSGYDINRASNGVWLPLKEVIAVQVRLPLHSGGHLKKYFNTVDYLLVEQTTKAQDAKKQGKPWDEVKLLSVLSKIEAKIRKDLLNLGHPLKLQKNDPLKPVDLNPKKTTFY